MLLNAFKNIVCWLRAETSRYTYTCIVHILFHSRLGFCQRPENLIRCFMRPNVSYDCLFRIFSSCTHTHTTNTHPWSTFFPYIIMFVFFVIRSCLWCVFWSNFMLSISLFCLFCTLLYCAIVSSFSLSRFNSFSVVCFGPWFHFYLNLDH